MTFHLAAESVLVLCASVSELLGKDSRDQNVTITMKGERLPTSGLLVLGLRGRCHHLVVICWLELQFLGCSYPTDYFGLGCLFFFILSFFFLLRS